MMGRRWVLWGLWAFVPAAVQGQAGRRDVNEGNRLFAEGRFDEARERYLDAVRAAPESPIARFNAANALYRTDDFQNALAEYQQSLELGDPALQALAWYNLGNALYQQQDLEKSLEAFKQTLRMNPDDRDAKHNLERVLEQMQEQEQQQDQNGDESQDGSDEENPDQQQNQDQPQDQDGGGDGEDQPDPSEQGPDDNDGQNSEDERDQQPPQEGQGEPRMTPEEVERLLQAVNEDPNEMRRQAAARARPVKVKKNW